MLPAGASPYRNARLRVFDALNTLVDMCAASLPNLSLSQDEHERQVKGAKAGSRGVHWFPLPSGRGVG